MGARGVPLILFTPKGSDIHGALEVFARVAIVELDVNFMCCLLVALDSHDCVAIVGTFHGVGGHPLVSGSILDVAVRGEYFMLCSIGLHPVCVNQLGREQLRQWLL